MSCLLTTDGYFVYHLGPPMVPARMLRAAMPGDPVQRNARAQPAIDTLLAGQFDLLGQVVAETKRRAAEGEADEG